MTKTKKHESIVSRVSLILSNWQFVCTYITRYQVFGIVSSLSAWLNGTILMR